MLMEVLLRLKLRQKPEQKSNITDIVKFIVELTCESDIISACHGVGVAGTNFAL